MSLGDKIVIMNDGRIQQVGDPHEIYNDPTNLFVARFIGSPSINQLDGRIADTDGGLTVSTDLFDVDLTTDAARAAAASEGDAVTLAVRPEHLDLQSETALFDATIDLVEPHGDRDAIYISAGDEDLAAVVDQGALGSTTGQIQVDVDQADVWLFDDRGERLV